MSWYKLKLVRLVASCVYIIRYRVIARTPVVWIVVSGTVGKTITRQTIAHSLRAAGASVVSRESNYVNELGVLCTLFDVGPFSLWSLAAWVRLLGNPIVPDTYFCIELGADFCLDIPWFLARFTPQIVVITADTSENWTGVVPTVRVHRLTLAHGATKYVLISDQVTKSISEVFPAAVVTTTTDDLYSFPKAAARIVCTNEGLVAPLLIVPYQTNRFSVTSVQQSVIIRDLYKVTPVCLQYSLQSTLKAAMPRSIFIMTEIRPSLISYAVLYAPYLAELRACDEVYFIGDKRVYAYLQSKIAIRYLEQENLSIFVLQLKNRIRAGERLAVGIKTAGVYKLTALGTI